MALALLPSIRGRHEVRLRYSYVRDTSIVPPSDVEVMHVGDLSGFKVYPFNSTGRVAGLLAVLRRRAYVIGATQRGFFYRFGAKIFSPCTGYFDSTFALKTQVSQIDLMLKARMRNEILPVRFRPDWIHGSLHLSRTGCCSFIFTAIDPNRFPKMEGASLEEIATVALNPDSFYDEDN